MFSLRSIKTEDYPMLCRWWSWFRFPAPPIECLPSNGENSLGGAIVMNGKTEICAGFLYFTNSKMCWLEFIVSNPDYREKDRKEAIQYLIYELSEIAKRKGFKVVFTSVKHPSLIKHYSDCGYSNSGSNTTEMVKLL